MREKSKNDHVSVEKSETIHKYCPAALETAFGIKFLLDTKLENSGF